MRVHSAPQRGVQSSHPLDSPLDPALLDTSVPAVFPPALRRYPFNGLAPGSDEYEQEQPHRPSQDGLGGSRSVPTVSERIVSGAYGRRSNPYDENGIEVQLANGDLAMIGNRLCREDSGISIHDPHGTAEGSRGSRLERLKKMCSFQGTLSGVGSDADQPTGVSRSQHWMLIVTPVVSSFSLALVIAAVVGPQWLLTEEKIPIAPYQNSSHGTAGTVAPAQTGSHLHNQQLNIQHPHLIPATKDDASGGYFTKYTKSSLWMLCSKYAGGTVPIQPQQHTVGTDFQCASIDYFPTEGYSPDPNDSSNAIPYTVTHSSPFFLASNGVLIVSYGLFLVAMCSTKHKICYFVSGVLFIISGLLMLIGLIMYISILKAEIGSKLRPRSSLQAPQFTFRYGQSFLLYVFGFIITELSGILNVLIYSNVQQDEYDGQSVYPTYQNLSGGIHYNLHYRREWPHPAGDEPPKVLDGPPIVDYRYPYDGLGCEASPRYYFEQQQQQHQQQQQQQQQQQDQQRQHETDLDCRVHRGRSLGRASDGMSKSLSDLMYMEPTQLSPNGEFTSIRAYERTNGHQQGHRVESGVDTRSPNAMFAPSRWSPRTGRLTRSVSTYTDLLPMGVECAGEVNGGRTRSGRGTTHSPTRSDDEGTAGGKVSNICGLSRQYLSRELSKEKLFNEFCKKVGPRPKPKNIYYIESDGRNGDDSYRSVFVVDPGTVTGRTRVPVHRRRNSVADTRRRFTAQDQSPSCGIGFRQRVRSDNSLDDLVDDVQDHYGRRRDAIGRARSVDYRQTLPRNFAQRHGEICGEPEDETGGFGERIALERKRVSASGLLLPEPERLNASHGDLTSEETFSGGTRWQKSGSGGKSSHHHQSSSVRASPLCPRYLDPPGYASAAMHQQSHPVGKGPSSSDSHTFRSYGDLTSHHHSRRPTILSPQVFSPISQPATPPVVRSILTVVQQPPQHHRHVHHQHQHHRRHEVHHHVEPIPSPVFDLDRIEQERRKSHSQLFLSTSASSGTTMEQYDFVNGTAV